MAVHPSLYACQIETADSVGSGVLVAPGVVMTALHVVLGADPPAEAPAGALARVRLLADLYRVAGGIEVGYGDGQVEQAWLDLSERAEWRQATMIWPPAGAAVHTHDCALLALPDAVWPFAGEAPIAPARLNRQVECIGFGFPRFRTVTAPRTGLEMRNVYTLFGAAGTANAPDLFSRAAQIDVASPAPDDADGWKGLSGAPVFVDGDGPPELLGVMHERADQVHGNTLLSFWPIATIADPDFWAACGWARPGAPEATAPAPNAPPVDLKKRFIEFDRSVPTAKFSAWLSGDRRGRVVYGRRGPPTKPFVVVLQGHRVDEVAHCARRLAHDLSQGKFRDAADLYDEQFLSHFEDPELDPDTRSTKILQGWAKRVAAEKPGQRGIEDLIGLVAEGLRAGDKPRAIILEHSTPDFTEDCRLPLYDALEALRAASDASPPPVLFLCAVTGADEGAAEAAFLPEASYPEKADAFARAIEEIKAEYEDLEWLTDIRPLDRDRPRPVDVEDWFEDLEDEIGAPPARAAAEALVAPFPRYPMRFALRVLNNVFSTSGG